jgi:hypothetical protein
MGGEHVIDRDMGGDSAAPLAPMNASGDAHDSLSRAAPTATAPAPAPQGTGASAPTPPTALSAPTPPTALSAVPPTLAYTGNALGPEWLSNIRDSTNGQGKLRGAGWAADQAESGEVENGQGSTTTITSTSGLGGVMAGVGDRGCLLDVQFECQVEAIRSRGDLAWTLVQHTGASAPAVEGGSSEGAGFECEACSWQWPMLVRLTNGRIVGCDFVVRSQLSYTYFIMV